MNLNEHIFSLLINNVNIPRELIDSGNILYYAKNSEITKIGEIIDNLYIIVEGKVKVTCHNNSGDVYIMRYLSEGDIIGEGDIFDNIKKPTLFSMVAIEDCRICKIPFIEVLTYSKKHPELLITFINKLNYKLFILTNHINGMVFNKPNERVAFILYELSIFYGNKNNNKTELPFQFTHQELSDLANCTRVTVTRTLNTLKNEGILNHENGRLIINDMDRLKDILNF